MKSVFVYAIAAALLVVSHPSNDWSKPCFNGECAYDIPATAHGSGSLQISGPANLIADITPAAGWVILSCDPIALVQDIRMTCKEVDEQAVGCSHLFEDGGPVNKLVRLPESCSKAPFARIAGHRIQDQPNKRDATFSRVHIIQIDTNYEAFEGSRPGTVSFAFHAFNFRHLEHDLVPPAGTDLHIREVTSSAHDSLENVANWDIDKKVNLPHIAVKKKRWAVLDVRQTCASIEAKLNADISCDISATASVGIVASGSIIPPKVNKFGLYTELTADLTGSVVLDTGLSGSISSSDKVLFQQGLPGMSVPGIITVGPSFILTGSISTSIPPNTSTEIGINYHIEKARGYFPPSIGRSSGVVKIQDTPLKLTASPSAKGMISAHIIPKLNYGVKVFQSKTNIYFAADARATLNIKTSAGTMAPEVNYKRSYTPPYDVNARAIAVVSAATCADLTGAMDITIGAKDSLQGLWKPGTVHTVQKNKWQIYKACPGDSAAKRSLNRPSSLEVRSAGLTCPTQDGEPPVSVIDTVVNKNDIKPV